MSKRERHHKPKQEDIDPVWPGFWEFLEQEVNRQPPIPDTPDTIEIDRLIAEYEAMVARASGE